MSNLNAVITGVGIYLPDYRLTNDELSTMVDTNDEWITTRIGIKERRILKDKDKASAFMGAEAVKQLLEKTGTNPDEVDMVICATVTPDYYFPATGIIIAEMAGLKNAYAFDVHAACSGFLYALTTAAKFIQAGREKKIIVVGAEKMSSIVDYTDRKTCPIFGDAAAAVMVEATEENLGVMDYILRSDGEGVKYLHMKGGGSICPASEESIKNKEHYIYQDGQPVFKFAVTRMADVSAEIMERNNLTADDIAWLVPHQANLRIIDATARRMELDPSKVMINIQRYGNTTSATIPLCLYEWENKLHKGDNLILAAFGAGFTWGSVWLKWGYDPK
ncbi:MAG: ketoacyl-ACP synthase III [Bacteroidales bacterium]|jgi:3-oxoacyl-[acyl-carrier-protein] synthase-3|nr:ketoacyl-ACP synthase III [Bacteroidales bacterium]